MDTTIQELVDALRTGTLTGREIQQRTGVKVLAPVIAKVRRALGRNETLHSVSLGQRGSIYGTSFEQVAEALGRLSNKTRKVPGPSCEEQIERIEATRNAESEARLRSLAPHLAALVKGAIAELQAHSFVSTELASALGLRDGKAVGAFLSFLSAQSGVDVLNVSTGIRSQNRLYSADPDALSARLRQVKGELADLGQIADLLASGPTARSRIVPLLGEQDLDLTLRRVETLLRKSQECRGQYRIVSRATASGEIYYSTDPDELRRFCSRRTDQMSQNI